MQENGLKLCQERFKLVIRKSASMDRVVRCSAVTTPSGIEEMVTEGCGLVMASDRVSWWLDSEVFSKLNDSMMLTKQIGSASTGLFLPQVSETSVCVLTWLWDNNSAIPVFSLWGGAEMKELSCSGAHGWDEAVDTNWNARNHL